MVYDYKGKHYNLKYPGYLQVTGACTLLSRVIPLLVNTVVGNGRVPSKN